MAEDVVPVHINSLVSAFVYALTLRGFPVRRDDSLQFFLLDQLQMAALAEWRKSHSGYRQVDNILYTWMMTAGVDMPDRMFDTIIHLSEEELDLYSQWLGSVLVGWLDRDSVYVRLLQILDLKCFSQNRSALNVKGRSGKLLNVLCIMY